MALHVPYESPVVIIDLGKMGSAVLQVDWGNHVGMIALFAIMPLGSLDCAVARLVLVYNMWTQIHWIENVARFPVPGAHTLAHNCGCRLASRVNIIRAGPSLCQRSRGVMRGGPRRTAMLSTHCMV